MKKEQKIDCSVDTCIHNNVAKCECRLEEIRVCPCKITSDKTAEAQTACGMYHYCGDLNTREIMNSRQEES